MKMTRQQWVANQNRRFVERLSKKEYAPYDTMPEFEQGVDDYLKVWRKYDGVKAQAYDRGLEYAMRVIKGE